MLSYLFTVPKPSHPEFAQGGTKAEPTTDPFKVWKLRQLEINNPPPISLHLLSGN
jgi:hypothetical protein